MTNGVATAAQPVTHASRRLSPKVRRLLRHHHLAPDDVRGTGTRGRITPTDVERTARGDAGAAPRGRPGGSGPALASPLARRLLRDAGLSPDDVPATGPITRAVAERALADRDTSAARSTARSTATVDVDLSRVLSGVGAAHAEVRRRWGVELTPLAPIAHAVCRCLRRNPGVNTPGAADTGGVLPDVDLAVVVATPDGPAVAGVPTAQDLTITALADRVAAVPGASTGDGDAATFAITGDGWATDPVDTGAALPSAACVLRVDRATQQSVEVTDGAGGTATATRWVASLRLAHDPDLLDETAAAQFLDELKRELETVDLFAAIA